MYAIRSYYEQCAKRGIGKVRVHALLDGRDVGQKSALDYIKPLEEKLRELSSDGRDYRVGSGGGRMVTTMDRYNANWQVVEKGWKAHVLGEGSVITSYSIHYTKLYEWRSAAGEGRRSSTPGCGPGL